MNQLTAKDQRSRKQKIFIVLMLGALNTITPFSIDMYLPAFPKIANDFHTTIGNVALSVSTYFLGFSIGQIVYGPLLDRFGRKRPLYVGLGLYIIATIGCVTSGSIETLLVIRFVQALCGCVASVAAMAMVRDFFPADQGSRIISLLVLILGVSPLLAPTAGGFIVTAFGWHYVFVILAVVALLIWIFIFFFLPEGQQPDATVSLKPKPIIAGFTTILIEPKFYVFALAGSFSFAGLFVYVAGSPAIFMDTFHTSAKMYGGIFAFLSIGFIGGSQLNHLLSRRYSNEVIFKTTIIIQVAVAIFYLICVSNSLLGIGGNIAFLFVLLSCAGLSYPNAASIALSLFDKNAGSASALLGFIQIGIGGVISSLVGLIHLKGTMSTSLAMSISASVGLIILLLGKKVRSVDNVETSTILHNDQQLARE